MDISGLVVTGLALCFQVSSTLYSYGKEVKGARREIQSLSNELFGLIGALEHLKTLREQIEVQQTQLDLPPAYETRDDRAPQTDNGKKTIEENAASQETVDAVLKQTIEFLKELQEILAAPKSRFKSAMQLMKWPLRESEVQRHLNRLERVKTYFILSMVTDEVDQSRTTALEIAALRTLIQDTSLKQQANESRKEHEAYVRWLCPVDPSVTRRSIEKTRASGTGVWFTKSKAFQKQCSSSESSCFWLNGITGAGKTTLMTTAIAELMEKPVYDFAYFYCTFTNDESTHTQNILGSILAQISREGDAVYEETRATYAQSSTTFASAPPQLETDALVGLIARQAQNRRRLHLVVDGVNECSDSYGLLSALEKLLKSANGVQLLISSINEKGIEQSVDRMPKSFQVTISARDIRHDISTLVSSTLKNHPRLSVLPPDLKADITTELTDGAQGMFRWVQCQLDLLSKLRTSGAVQKALASLPHTLDQTYEFLLERIEGEEDRYLTKQILQISAFSLRPLDLDELSTILQITPGTYVLDKSKCLTNPEDILDICGSLLKYNEKTRLVTLAHHSVKLYLTLSPRNAASYFKIHAEEAHYQMALLCLTYLSFEAFNTENDESISDRKYPFLAYAKYNWGLHLKEVQNVAEPLWSTLRSFLLSGDEGRCNFVNWVRVLIPDSKFKKSTPPLYYAASFGLISVVKYLLDVGVDFEEHGGRGGATPINIAAYRGHLDVVKLFLEHGADPLKGDLSTGLNAVQWSAVQKQYHVLDFFEESGYRSRHWHDKKPFILP